MAQHCGSQPAIHAHPPEKPRALWMYQVARPARERAVLGLCLCLCLALVASAGCHGKPVSELIDGGETDRDSAQTDPTGDSESGPVLIALPKPPGPGTSGPMSVDPDDDASVADEDDAGNELARILACGAGSCDLGDSGACPEGRTCKFIHSPGRSVPEALCVPSANASEGDDCTTYADCGAGLDCTAEGSAGQCRAYCCEANQIANCPAGQFCKIALQASGGELTDSLLCNDCDDCEVNDAHTCKEGQACYLISTTRHCRACLPIGTTTPGARCAWANDCGARAGCFTVEGAEARCLEYCRVDAENQCDEGSRCRPVAGVALGDGVGVCLAIGPPSSGIRPTP